MTATAEQKALLACLTCRNPTLARIYDGGLRVFYDDKNPDRFPLTAHSMRELIDNCPVLTGPQRAQTGDTMIKRLEPVKKAYLAMKAVGDDASRLDPPEAAGRAVLRALDDFFQWVDDNRPQAAKRTAQMLSGLSGPGQRLPVDISNNEVVNWMAADEYFKKVAHHGQDNVDENEFMAHMTFIESVLLPRLRPPAVADLDALDALIREGENGH